MAEKSNEVNNENKTADIKSLFTILKELIRIPSPSGQERELADYILKEYTHGSYRYNGIRDDFSNVFLFPDDMKDDEKLPILNAHLDIYNKYSVLTAEQLDRLRDADILTLDPKTLTITKKYQQIVGFDDKIGIAIILWLMKYTDLRFKVILSSQEEETKRWDLKIKDENGNQRGGGGGIQYALTSSKPLAFIKNSRFGLILDRKGREDIIAKYWDEDLCSKHFLSELEKISDTVKFHMKSVPGIIGDAYNIRVHTGLNVVNLSCGIYSQHMTGEYLNIKEAFGTLKVVKYCLEKPDLLDNLKQPIDALASDDMGIKYPDDPDNAMEWYYRGNSLDELDQPVDAIASYDKALAINPDFAAAWNQRGNMLYYLRRHEDAVASYDKALAINPNDAEAWFFRGLTLGDLGRYSDAVASYDKALAIEPNHRASENREIALQQQDKKS